MAAMSMLDDIVLDRAVPELGWKTHFPIDDLEEQYVGSRRWTVPGKVDFFALWKARHP